MCSCWWVGGLQNKQAAERLGVSEATIKAHRGQIMRKMGAGSVAELVRVVGELQAGGGADGDPTHFSG